MISEALTLAETSQSFSIPEKHFKSFSFVSNKVKLLLLNECSLSSFPSHKSPKWCEILPVNFYYLPFSYRAPIFVLKLFSKNLLFPSINVYPSSPDNSHFLFQPGSFPFLPTGNRMLVPPTALFRCCNIALVSHHWIYFESNLIWSDKWSLTRGSSITCSMSHACIANVLLLLYCYPMMYVLGLCLGSVLFPEGKWKLR